MVQWKESPAGQHVELGIAEHNLFLALGEGDRISPWVAGWTPNLLFAAIGLYLLYLRASNREAPGFHLLRARRILAR